MLLFLFFLHLIKHSQRNVGMSHYDYIFFLFPYISSAFCFMYLSFVVRCLTVYGSYFLCELYLLSLKILIFVSFITNKENKNNAKKKRIRALKSAFAT